MLQKIGLLFLLTLIPGLELRVSIPVGFFSMKMPMAFLLPVCILANILVGVAVFFLLPPLLHCARKAPWIDRTLGAFLDRAQRKLAPSVAKHGFWGLALFIGIPLPMTGAYTGAAGAFVLGMKPRQFLLANLAGVCIAALCVTIVCLLIQAGCDLPILKLFIQSPQ